MWPPSNYACVATLDSVNAAVTRSSLDLHEGIETMDDY